MKCTADIIAENIKRERKRLGLSQEELGEMLSYSVKSVSKWETGGGTPPTVLLPRLAAALKVDVNYLLSEQAASRYFLGIDGGGTKTEFALADENGAVIRSLLLGTSNPSDIGIQKALEVLREGIHNICMGLPKNRISLFAGLAGASTKGISEQIAKFLAELGFFSAEFGSDAKNAVAAGLGGRDGIAVIMGTGCVAFAQSDNVQYRVGGYGYLLGDLGSGFAFGRDAILAALQYEDGSGESTAIYELVRARCQGETVLEKLGRFYEGGKREIAQYAPCVFDAYAAGDTVARDILERNMESIANTIRGAARKVRGDGVVRVVLCGGISTSSGQILIPMLEKMLSSDTRKYEISICERTMIIGALTLAGMPAQAEEEKENPLC